MASIESLRKKIQRIDASIIKKIAKRQALAKEIGQLKVKEGKDIVDLSQEEKLFKFYELLCAKYGLQSSFVKQLFQSIIAYCRKIQKF